MFFFFFGEEEGVFSSSLTLTVQACCLFFSSVSCISQFLFYFPEFDGRGEGESSVYRRDGLVWLGGEREKGGHMFLMIERERKFCILVVIIRMGSMD